ncbi:MAG: isocitrate lyase/PEP mutase family protein [Planctomycetota bacterium]|nr:isocitrate lyase/PEP mutase family protein [Planctomycetota bacterium]
MNRRIQFHPGRLMRIGGAHDALSARLLAEAGFPAIWMSGFGLAAAQFAFPDINLVTMTESVEAARRAATAAAAPLIVDADNGFGDARNVARAVREYGQAGVAGICLEDNVFPKRCSLYPGAPRELVTPQEMCDKLESDRRAADPFGMLLIGRVESLIAGLDPEDAVARANAYAEAGADAILIHGRAWAPLREIALSRRVPKPLVLVPTLFHDVSLAEVEACGFSAVIFANQLLRATVHAARAMLGPLLRAGALTDVDRFICPVADINHLVGVPAEWDSAAGTASKPPTARGPVPSRAKA